MVCCASSNRGSLDGVKEQRIKKSSKPFLCHEIAVTSDGWHKQKKKSMVVFLCFGTNNPNKTKCNILAIRGIEPRADLLGSPRLTTKLRRCHDINLFPTSDHYKNKTEKRKKGKQKRIGGSGFRSPCLIDANDALYQLS